MSTTATPDEINRAITVHRVAGAMFEELTSEPLCHSDVIRALDLVKFLAQPQPEIP
jgi:hypothetical protein